MTIDSRVNWKDLETRGFLHIPDFLSPDELAACQADYAAQPANAGNRNYSLAPASERGVGPVRHRIQEVLAAVNANTRLQVDQILEGSYFATKRGIVFNWHQDHESYFECQNHFDYLNFYIPVVKPVKNKTNLCVVPFDVLERESPKTFRRVVRGGATTTYDRGGRQLVIQDQLGITHLVRSNLNDMAATPQLEAGDLLLMRGDMLHRTEDNDTDRVSLSIRTANSRTIVHRAHLADGGLAKASMMARNDDTYMDMFRAFDEAGQNQLPFGEMMKRAKDLRRRRPPDTGRFRYRLIREKIRSGVFLSFVRKALSEAVVRPLVVRYHSRAIRPAATQSAAKVAERTT
jgi:hypothetical protein